MSFEIKATAPFERNLKKLSKKHKSLKNDLQKLFEELEKNPTKGQSLGSNCYKIRLAISSKGKGKSGGARIITYVKIVKQKVFLLNIYDKSQKETLSEKELRLLLELLSEE